MLILVQLTSDSRDRDEKQLYDSIEKIQNQESTKVSIELLQTKDQALGEDAILSDPSFNKRLKKILKKYSLI